MVATDDESEDFEAEQTAVSLRTLEPRAHFGQLPDGLRAALEIVSGDGAGKRFEFDRVPCLIGRGKHATFQLHDIKLSRLHAAIAYEETEFRIVDNKSGNGTMLNGSKVESYRLQDGDMLLVGDTTLRFRVISPSRT